jgi:hypothetical protein
MLFSLSTATPQPWHRALAASAAALLFAATAGTTAGCNNKADQAATSDTTTTPAANNANTAAAVAAKTSNWPSCATTLPTFGPSPAKAWKKPTRNWRMPRWSL